MVTIDDIVVEPPADGVVVNPQTWFAAPGPLEIEIGCGKGGFLLARARARPDVRLFGIEWANKYFRYAADRMARWGIGNVRLMRTDAKHFFIHHLAAGCVDALHVYHPDPWPKKRHHKRRLIQPDFVEAAVRALRPGGKWLLCSDHEEYFEHIRSLLDPHPAFSQVPWNEIELELGTDWAGTNYEIKYARAGRSIFRVAYVRRG